MSERALLAMKKPLDAHVARYITEDSERMLIAQINNIETEERNEDSQRNFLYHEGCTFNKDKGGWILSVKL